MALRTNVTIPANETALGRTNKLCGLLVPHSAAERISLIFLYCVNLMGSFFGNIFIVIIVYKHRDLRKTINYFIVNMAVSDLLNPLIVIPVSIVGLATDSSQWRVSGILGSGSCKLFRFSSAVALHVSTQSLVWLAIDRFVAVVFPIKLGLISPRIRTTAIVSTWIFAALFSSPSLITFDVVVHDNQNSFCISTDDSFKNPDLFAAIPLVQLSLVFIVPLVVITVLYTTIAIALKRQNRALRDSAKNLQRHSEKKRRQAVRMSVTIVALFYICVIPSTFLYFTHYWSFSCATQRLFLSLATFAFSSTSMVNPIICLSFVASYRRGLRNILRPCTKTPDIMTKREQVGPQEMENITGDNCGRVLKDTKNYKDTLNTAL